MILGKVVPKPGTKLYRSGLKDLHILVANMRLSGYTLSDAQLQKIDEASSFADLPSSIGRLWK
ncbi:hypothetical protein C5167_011404 [Papaver somniferum]|uniref:Uncharacterized protein n=1 Tax=Papaver somniferum TaxID=3469 RepID=A0A4Y7K6V2_PAPSO|nr:hypothetical protein C5167_011404 [Papaver somniferum]